MTRTKIDRYHKIVQDQAKITDFVDHASLGKLLGFYRFLTDNLDDLIADPDLDIDPYDLHDALGKRILTDLISRHKRVDHREHWAMISYLSDLGFEIVQLPTGEGDIASNRVKIERKEDDLLPSLFDDRRLRQLGAMREEAEFSYLVVTKSYREIRDGARERGIPDKILLGFVASLCAIGYPPIFIGDRYDASNLIHRIVEKIEDDRPRLYVPRPKSPDPIEYRNAMIESLPKIGSKIRRRITNLFPSIQDLAQASIEDLMEIEGVGETTAKRIHEIMRGGGSA